MMQHHRVVRNQLAESLRDKGINWLLIACVAHGLLIIAHSSLANDEIDDAPAMTTIPGGDFIMGNPEWKDGKEHEGPLHRVRISKFQLGTYEVTQAQWKAVMESNPSDFSAHGDKRDKVKNVDADSFPVENITWYEAVIFCNRLSERAGLKPYYQLTNRRDEEFTFLGTTEMLTRYDVRIMGGNGYRLPSEAEWEYACRGGTRTRYSFGDACNGTRANVNGKYTVGTDIKGPVRDQPLPVGSFKPNAFGLYDMHGNVAEWCMDERDDETYGRRGEWTANPIVSRRVVVGGSGARHIVRGGAWQTGALAATSHYRTSSTPTHRSNNIGFRVARSVGN